MFCRRLAHRGGTLRLGAGQKRRLRQSCTHGVQLPHHPHSRRPDPWPHPRRTVAAPPAGPGRPAGDHQPGPRRDLARRPADDDHSPGLLPADRGRRSGGGSRERGRPARAQPADLRRHAPGLDHHRRHRHPCPSGSMARAKGGRRSPARLGPRSGVPGAPVSADDGNAEVLHSGQSGQGGG